MPLTRIFTLAARECTITDLGWRSWIMIGRTVTPTLPPLQSILVDRSTKTHLTLDNQTTLCGYHFEAISIRLGITGTAAQRFHGLLEWAQQQLDGDTTQAAVVLPVVADQAKTLAWLTEEISSLRQWTCSQHRSGIWEEIP